MDLFGLILLGTLCASCTRISVSFFRFRGFQPQFHQMLFGPFYILWGSYNANVGMTNVVSEVPETAFILKNFSFFCSYWVISIILSSRSCMCSSVPPKLLLMRLTLAKSCFIDAMSKTISNYNVDTRFLL